MTKVKILFINLFILTLIASCGSVKQAFDSERKNSTDEFLVEKKKSLSFPPNYNDLPKPIVKNIPNEEIDEIKKDDIENLIINENINVPQKQKTNKKLELLILEKINEDN